MKLALPSALSPSAFASRRWVHLALWTGFMLYSMAVINPSQNPVVWLLIQFADRLGLPPYLPTKVFHVLSFGIWAALLHAALAGGLLQSLRPLRRKIIFYGLLLIYLALPEALQALNPHRNPSFSDVVINAAGAITAILLLRLARPPHAEE